MERAHERQGHLDNYTTDYMLLCFSYYHSEPLDRWAETMDIRRHAGWADVRETTNRCLDGTLHRRPFIHPVH